MNNELNCLAQQLGDFLLAQQKMLATAESCTGGLIAQIVTDISGSSQWFERGFVTYSNQAKEEMLNVPAEILAKYGAVSVETAIKMAEGALQNSQADIAVSVTGIAGPSGGTSEKPVGTVIFAWATKSAQATSEICHFIGTRNDIRQQSAAHALRGLLAQIFH